MEGILHAYQAKPVLNLFEYTPHATSSPRATTTSPNILLFVGGLYDNFSSPSYLIDFANLFPRHESQQWSLMHVQLSSAMRGFGTSDIDRDIVDLSNAVQYIRDVIRKGQPTNVVLFGQSTGCQILLHYLHSPGPRYDTGASETIESGNAPRAQVQGAILQAPVSDRSLVLNRKVQIDPDCARLYENCMSLVATIPESRHDAYILPLDWTMRLYGRACLSITRFLDLASPWSPSRPRKEDLFSVDLSQASLNGTFGRVGANKVLVSTGDATPSILILISELDTDVLKPLGAYGILKRWDEALGSDPKHRVELHSSSREIPEGTHDLSGESLGEQKARLVQLREAVLRYVNDVVGGVDDFAWAEWRKGMQKLDSILNVDNL